MSARWEAQYNWVQIIPLTQFNVKVPHFSYESQEILTLLEDFGKG